VGAEHRLNLINADGERLRLVQAGQDDGYLRAVIAPVLLVQSKVFRHACLLTARAAAFPPRICEDRIYPRKRGERLHRNQIIPKIGAARYLH